MHILQLFDTPESLAASVADYLHAGMETGEHLLAVVKQKNWTRIAQRLAERGCDVAEAGRTGQLTVLDAKTTLSLISRDGAVNQTLFGQHVGRLLARILITSRGRVRIYGEMVDVLATEGELAQAHHLEQFWNDLGTRQPFTLLCGYSAAHFTGHDGQPALQVICGEHAEVRTHSSDVLACWLLGRYGLPS